MNVGAANTTGVDRDIDIILSECLELELLLVKALPSVILVNEHLPFQVGELYCLGSLMTKPVAVSG